VERVLLLKRLHRVELSHYNCTVLYSGSCSLHYTVLLSHNVGYITPNQVCVRAYVCVKINEPTGAVCCEIWQALCVS
jgi:hypothetical protein